MTQEEKAKRYDEALALMVDCVPDEDGLVHVRPHEIFPEFKESEDEKIIREITEFILTHRIDEPNDIEDTNSWLAWLEKQGKSKWTEEDDTIRCEIIRRMEALDHYWNRPNDQKLIDWLKGLKQRMEEQE